MGRKKPLHYKRKPTGYSRIGCVQCKKAHVKCDEQSPVCKRCTRLDLPCTYKVPFIVENSSQQNTAGRPLDTAAVGAAVVQPMVTETDMGCNNGNDCSMIEESQRSTGQDLTTQNISNELGTPLNLTVDDLVLVLPGDLDFMSSLDHTFDDFIFEQETFVPNYDLFDLQWKSHIVVDYLGSFNKFEPEIYPTIHLNDKSLLDFAWTLVKSTHFFFNFSMYPDETFMEVIDVLLTLGRIFPIIHSIVLYDCSMLMKEVYAKENMNEKIELWDKNVRIPVFKICLDVLSDRIDNSTSFAEYVSLTFAVVIIFAANVSDSSWRTHFHGCQQLLHKSSNLKHTARSYNHADRAALQLLDILVEWFQFSQFVAQISSNHGWDNLAWLESPDEQEVEQHMTSVLNNGIVLICGYSKGMKPIVHKLQLFLKDWKDKGVNLCGTNLVKYALQDKNPGVEGQIKSFGYELRAELQLLKRQNYKRSTLKDFMWDCTLKHSNTIHCLGLDLYLTVFFIGIKDHEVLTRMVEELLESVLCMPYHSTAGVYCHWEIYIGGLVSLILEDQRLYSCFVELLHQLLGNGMYVVEKSLDGLENIGQALDNGNLDNLVDPNQDFALI